MKIVIVNNDYRAKGAVESIVHDTKDVLVKNGHQVVMLTRDSNTISNNLKGKIGAFFSGIYSRSAYRAMVEIIRREKPDVVHAHNLYPLFSPSVLAACRSESVPTILTCHDYRETCPTFFHYRDGNVCELCAGGREYYCVLKNCRGNLPESIAYALRSSVANAFRLIQTNTTVVIALTEFAKRRLCAAGFDERRIVVIPNMVGMESPREPSPFGEYIAFAGRLSPEKGIETLLAAARSTQLPVHIAGDGPLKAALATQSPSNVRFVGELDRQSMEDFYRRARFVVVPSKCYEVCPMVIVEAMSHGKAVVASRIGGLPEMVKDELTGLLFEPGNAADLATKIDRLWNDNDRCVQMGEAGRRQATEQYGEPAFYGRLVAAYQKAIEMSEEMEARAK
jgi:glycosyltransferase involved in cell wall biosynthesis